ncbi:MAG: hypothetical protein KDE47_23155, partial [Caldilineaceae bacterium]|nr:hypothetical protein [Caldilineaceae bacterium]
ILVATQVVEVGLDITCENLHTEIAPANAVFQRAGRCARYPGEQGHVHIYQVPKRTPRSQAVAAEEKAEDAKPNYLPYSADLAASAWQSFLARNGEVLGFEEEQTIIDEVHTESDRQLLDAMRRQADTLWQDISQTMENSASANRQRLIRRIDSVTLVAAPTPDEVGNPFAAQGFSLWRGSVKKVLRDLEEYLLDWEDDEFADAPWLMALPLPVEKDAEDPTGRPQIHWQEIREPSLIDQTSLVWINSQFCAYDSERGFRIVPPAQANGWQSTPGEFGGSNRMRGFDYQLENYQEHIETMLRIAATDFLDNVAYVQRKLLEQGILQPNGLQTAIKLAIAGHDLGKLHRDWQRWVRYYQAQIGAPIQDDAYMAVHTYSVASFAEHRAAKKQMDRQIARPRHAGESAVAVARVAAELLGNRALTLATLIAIARHHSPSTAEFTPFDLHPQTVEVFNAVLAYAELPTPANPLTLQNSKGGALERLLIQPDDFEQLLLYLYIVRILRLCDGLSQERK